MSVLSWIKYRKHRKKSAKHAANLAVQLVLNGCLVPPRLAGAKGRIEKVIMLNRQRFQAIVGPGGVA
jgi:hypothetical protein